MDLSVCVQVCVNSCYKYIVNEISVQEMCLEKKKIEKMLGKCLCIWYVQKIGASCEH